MMNVSRVLGGCFAFRTAAGLLVSAAGIPSFTVSATWTRGDDYCRDQQRRTAADHWAPPVSARVVMDHGQHLHLPEAAPRAALLAGFDELDQVPVHRTRGNAQKSLHIQREASASIAR